MDLLAYAMAAGYTISGLLYARQTARLEFYKAYFEEKQRNLGRDPKEVIREELPWILR